MSRDRHRRQKVYTMAGFFCFSLQVGLNSHRSSGTEIEKQLFEKPNKGGWFPRKDLHPYPAAGFSTDCVHKSLLRRNVVGVGYLLSEKHRRRLTLRRIIVSLTWGNGYGEEKVNSDSSNRRFFSLCRSCGAILGEECGKDN